MNKNAFLLTASLLISAAALSACGSNMNQAGQSAGGTASNGFFPTIREQHRLRCSGQGRNGEIAENGQAA
ncbi:hypothetical protein LJK87_47090 [Paenibacillus sp. P25]|nr:hypothetical protein LJK87_47090 [Paenibacillus sp. P25]